VRTGLPRLRCDFSSDPFFEKQGSQYRDVPRSLSVFGTSFWRAARPVLQTPLLGLGNALSCALLPSHCVLCDSFLTLISNTPVCDACWSEMPAQRENCCDRCGEDLFAPANGEKQLCRACRLAPPAFERAVSCGVYEGRMRSALHALKYERIAPIARELGRRLAAAIAEWAPGTSLGTPESDCAPDNLLVIPVPLHRGRMAERGFNQARNLASEALRVLGKTHPAWRMELSTSSLARQRSTESQSGLTPRQRRQNLRGAFFVSDSEVVRGRHILLIDDILTTGATARACSKTLMDAGAASVRVATVARAQRRVPLSPVDEQVYRNLTGRGNFVARPPTPTASPTVH